MAASISHFVTAATQNFYVVLPTKKCLVRFSSLAVNPCHPFFSLSFAGLPPTFSFSLSFSCSIFQIFGHDNLSKFNTLDNTNTETISAFRFRLYWLFVVSALQDAGGYAISRKIASSCIWFAIPVDWVILHWCACAGDRRSLGRAVYGHVITKFSRMGRLLHFLTHGTPLTRFARESSTIKL